MIQSTSSSDISISGSNEVAPALAKTRATGPSAAFAATFSCAIEPRSQTSQWMATALPPAAVISPATLLRVLQDDVGHGHRASLPRQLLRKAHADAAAPAGDDRRPAVDLRH